MRFVGGLAIVTTVPHPFDAYCWRRDSSQATKYPRTLRENGPERVVALAASTVVVFAP